MIVVYTVNLNHWDVLRPPQWRMLAPESGGLNRIQHICYTDQPGPTCEPWRIEPAYQPFQQASRNSRIPKILPHLHFRADYSIYHDANFTLKMAPEELIDRYLGARDIALFRHPCRQNVCQEGAVLLKERIGDPTEVQKQLERWEQVGSPHGLWCGGLIIRRHTPAVAALNEAWWREFAWGSTRDQMSLPIARELTRTSISTIDGDVYNNDLMAFHWHTAWVDKGDNPLQEMKRREFVERRKRLVEVVG